MLGEKEREYVAHKDNHVCYIGQAILNDYLSKGWTIYDLDGAQITSPIVQARKATRLVQPQEPEPMEIPGPPEIPPIMTLAEYKERWARGEQV